MARDQGSCRLLQARLEGGGDAALTTLVYREVLPHARTVAVDPFGNYLFQKLLDVLSPQRRSVFMRVSGRRETVGRGAAHQLRRSGDSSSCSFPDTPLSASSLPVLSSVFLLPFLRLPRAGLPGSRDCRCRPGGRRRWRLQPLARHGRVR
jgi:hypothetical protein